MQSLKDAGRLLHPAEHGLLLPPSKNPHFLPAPGSVPLTITAAILPPLTYYLALVLLPSSLGDRESQKKSKGKAASGSKRTGTWKNTVRSILKFTLAAYSVFSFIVLPFWYHVPGSAILSYQLGLVGCYGGCRVLDVFFLSWPRVPRRIQVPQPLDHRRRVEAMDPEGKDNPSDPEEKYPHSDNKTWLFEPLPKTLPERMWYAFDLMISMRGIGWDFATADVRHDRHPWQPPSRRQLRRAFFKLFPALIGSIATLRAILITMRKRSLDMDHLSIASLPAHLRIPFVLATGISLYTLFDFGYTFVSAASMPVLKNGAFAIERISKREGASKVLPPSVRATAMKATQAHNVDFFPLLNPIKIGRLCSLRSFWSKIWHRLFHRAFLIFGVLPMQHFALIVERSLAWTQAYVKRTLSGDHNKPIVLQEKIDWGATWPGRHPDPGRVLKKGKGDWGKVLGAFLASGIIHAVSERAALGGRLAQAPALLGSASVGWHSFGKYSLSRIIPPVSGAGEFMFFTLNGVGVCIEGLVSRYVMQHRKRALLRQRAAEGRAVDEKTTRFSRAELARWYDAPIGALWAVLFLAWTGECFVEGWVRSGIFEELTFLLL